LYTVVYDIGDIIEQPEKWARIFNSAKPVADLRKRDPAERAAILIQAWSRKMRLKMRLSRLSQVGRSELATSRSTLSTNKPFVQSNAAKHAQIAEVLAAIRRLMDVKVLVQTKLYEVDETFYKSLKLQVSNAFPSTNGSNYSGMARSINLFGRHWKAKAHRDRQGRDPRPLPRGPIMSQHHVRTLLPSPAQVRKGEKGRKAFWRLLHYSGRRSPQRPAGSACHVD